MRIVPDPGARPQGAADALAFTSANGVRAYAASGGAVLPAYAVGEASAREAEALGYPVVGVAGGDVASLAALVAKARPGRVLHPSGTASAGDLAGALTARGVPCERMVTYEAVAAAALPPGAARDIKAGVQWTVLFSPRSARLLTALVRAAGLTDAFARTRLAALSPAVAEATDLPFADVTVPDRPASSALVDIISGQDT